MHRRRLPAGVPLPARAGVAWSGSPARTERWGSVPPVRAGEGAGHRSLPIDAQARSVRRCTRVSPWGDERASAGGARPIAGRDHSHVLRRVRPDGAPGVSLSTLRRFAPARGCRGRFACDARVCWRARHDLPSVAGPRAVGLCLRPEWFSPGDRPTGFRKNVRATGPSLRPANGRSDRGRLGPASGLRSRVRSAPADVRSAGAILPWASRPLSGLRAGATTRSTGGWRSSLRGVAALNGPAHRGGRRVRRCGRSKFASAGRGPHGPRRVIGLRACRFRLPFRSWGSPACSGRAEINPAGYGPSAANASSAC